MKERLVLLTVLSVTPTLVFGQAGVQKTTQGHGPPMHIKHNESALTGCLTKNPYNEYELVDKKGIHTLLYSSTVPLDTYMGQTVTLVGELSAAPSTDTGTARTVPHFKVVDLRPAPGKCRK